MKEIDARGLSCPAPVLHTRAALEEDKPGTVRVVVDNPASQENVKRFLESQGFETALEIEGENYIVTGNCGSLPGPRREPKEIGKGETELRKILIMCATDRIGFGDDVLGLKLMLSFLRTLKEMGPELWRLVFVNNGVKLAVEGSEALEDLKELEKNGLKILVCGTCLTHFSLLGKKQVGETTNMLDIVIAMQLADKTINL
jgi:selenium metabolism protein YedF